MSFKHGVMDAFVMCGVSKVQRFIRKCLIDMFFPWSSRFWIVVMQPTQANALVGHSLGERTGEWEGHSCSTGLISSTSMSK